MTLKTLPGFEILTPATPGQFTSLFKSCAENGRPSYFRMTDHCNKTEVEVEFGKAKMIKRGCKGTVAVWAEMLDTVIKACSDIDVNILHYTTAAPFDYAAINETVKNNKLILCHPFYEGTFSDDIQRAFERSVEICEIGVPREVLRSYGTKSDKDVSLCFTIDAMREKIQNFVNAK